MQLFTDMTQASSNTYSDTSVRLGNPTSCSHKGPCVISLTWVQPLCTCGSFPLLSPPFFIGKSFLSSPHPSVPLQYQHFVQSQRVAPGSLRIIESLHVIPFMEVAVRLPPMLAVCSWQFIACFTAVNEVLAPTALH